MHSKNTIIIDLSEVIISGIMGIERQLSSRLQLPQEHVRSIVFGDPLHMLFRGRITENRYLESIAITNQWDISLDEMKEIIRSHFHRKVPGMIEFLPQLAENASLILHSDHAREWIKYIWDIYSFWDIFDATYFSFELGHEKSDVSTYRILLGKIGKRHSECVFIDDNSLNVETAQNFGIDSLLFVSASQLRMDLSHLFPKLKDSWTMRA